MDDQGKQARGLFVEKQTMKGALKFLPVCTAFCIVCAGWAAPMEPRAAASALAKQFSFDEGGSLPRVAVTDVKDLSGGVNELGRLLAEELIQAFFATGKCDVIERGMLEKLLKEQKLAATGILDPASTQQLGKISGVDYLFVGLLTDLGDAYSLHGRLLSTQTGVIAQVGSVEVAKSSETQPLRERTLARPEASGGGAQFAGKELGLRPGTVWFQDFSSYQPGDIPREAGDQFMVSRVEGIRKNAIKVRSGRKDGEGVFAVPFPRNFVFEFSHCH
ncbi:hypothetical protein HY256_09065, partial [Candidatus Sumerlaeota bacterium]|nr:hypothetical protein [Candidatus Sumerlaeota bacterium]